MAGRASIVGAAATHVGKVRDHNEDSHFFDADLGVFLVCDGMGGHAAGEVASALAIREICQEWNSEPLHEAAAQWLERGTPEARKQLIEGVRAGVLAAHHAILAEADRDDSKMGMGTTLVGAMIVGGELVFAHAGDSRAYLVRDGISMQLTEDHTLLARLLAAGIDVDVSGEGARFRSMLTNALGIGEECKVSTFVVPLADGDRFLLCSDGISEYVAENEVGDVLAKQSSPARAAQRLVDLALERGGGDNATAVVVRVLEAGETPLPAEQRRRDDAAIGACALWGRRVTPQQRLRALRIAIPRDHGFGDKLPAYALGDRVAWIVVDGELVQDGQSLGPGALVYPESLVTSGEPPAMPERDALAITRTDVRALAIRADDFRELCEDDGELGEALVESVAQLTARRKPRAAPRETQPPVDPGAVTDPHVVLRNLDIPAAHRPTDPNLKAIGEALQRERATTVPGRAQGTPEELPRRGSGPSRAWVRGESPVIGPAPPRAASPQLPVRPSPSPLAARGAGTPPRAVPTSATVAAPAPPQRPRTPTGRPPIDPSGPTMPPPLRDREPARATSPTDVINLGTAASRRAAAERPSAPGLRATSPAVRTEPAMAGSLAHAITQPMAAQPHAITQPLVTEPLRPFAPVSADADDSLFADPTVRTAPPPPPASPSASGRMHRRPPSEPEIETYFEIEADEPPERGSDPDVESELAISIALSGELDQHESMSVTLDEDVTQVMLNEVALSDMSQLPVDLTVVDQRQRAITAEDGAAVSGTISIPETAGGPARRARRHSEGWDD